MTTLDLSPIVKLTRQQFYDICAANPDAVLERNADGELIVMSPTGGETGKFNSELNADLVIWNRQTKMGVTFDSSTGFSLGNGADRAPDVAWIPLEKWNMLSQEERKGFLPLCPDFAIELLSPSDSWERSQRKMEEYREQGCRLGWLIDRRLKRVAIYRTKGEVQILNRPDFLSGEDVLPNFVLSLESLWE
jgi:Uma2 family endonuclease